MRKEHKEKRMKLVIVLEEYLYILGIHYTLVVILEEMKNLTARLSLNRSVNFF